MSSGSSGPPSVGGEERRLQRCIRDLVALNALAAACVGRSVDDAFDLALGALPTALGCDLVFLQMPHPRRRRAAVWKGTRVDEPGLLEVDAAAALASAPDTLMAFGSVTLHWLEMALPVGREQGRLIVARRTPFEEDTDRVLVRSAANLVGTALHGANVLEAVERKDEFIATAEKELHASEQRFQHLVNAVTDYAIFMLDATGHVVTWNPGAERIKGYRRQEIIGRHLSVFYTAEDRAASKPERILDTVRREGRVEDESWRVRKDGTRFWANVVISALREQSGEIVGFAKVTRDLTAERAAKEQEEELLREQLARANSEKAAQEWERINRAKDEFLATMSHELRTPLNAIHGWATILRKKPREEDKLDRGLEVIERNARTQTKLISDLLDVSRIITGKLRLSLARTDMFPLIEAAVDVVKPSAEGKGVRLVVDIDPSIGATMADAERLQQIIWNLLTNAVRFTPRGGRITVTADRTASGIILRVTDTGAGIAREHLPRLFERFMQVDSSTTRAHRGLGLGLAIVRHLVEAHGGTVEAESDGVGRGATFTVMLPIRAVDTSRREATEATEATQAAEGTETSEATEATEASEQGPVLRGVRVLVVEDDPDSLEVVCTVLQRAGARVTAATSAGEAFRALDSLGGFDIIISDIGMPEVDGYSLMRRIRARDSGADVPAIALTAYVRADDAERARRAGFQEHLAKPVEESRLLDAVRTWVPKAVGT